jgi:zinc protease
MRTGETGATRAPLSASGRWGLAPALLRALLPLGALTCAAVARAAVPGCQPSEHVTLKNGIEVVLSVDHSLPAVAVLSSVHVGSRNDPPGHEGLAHYVEHLTFRPSPPFTGVEELYTRAGALGMNATTMPDTTDYFAVVPAAHLEQALWLEARRLAIGLDAVQEAPAHDEHRVVQREHTLRFAKNPGLETWGAVYAALFPEQHPYRSMLPTENSTDRLTLADARWFFARYYRPERVRLVLVGDFDPAQAKQRIEQDFGALVARDATAITAGGGTPSFDTTPEAECRWATQPPQRSHSRVVIKTPFKNERLEFVWALPATEEPERWRPLLDQLAGDVREVARQAGLARDVNLELQRGELGHLWGLELDIVPGKEFEKVEPLVRSVFADLLASVPNERDRGIQRQAVETSERLREGGLLARAQELALRQCQPLQCTADPAHPAPSSLAELSRFDLKDALVVEQRYRRGASADGDVEVLP